MENRASRDDSVEDDFDGLAHEIEEEFIRCMSEPITQRGWGRLHRSTQELIEEAIDALDRVHPQTVRQVFYALVIRKVLPNDKSSYRRLGNALVEARKRELISWEWIEDRLRRPHSIAMWANPADFADSIVPIYRRRCPQSRACRKFRGRSEKNRRLEDHCGVSPLRDHRSAHDGRRHPQTGTLPRRTGRCSRRKRA